MEKLADMIERELARITAREQEIRLAITRLSCSRKECDQIRRDGLQVELRSLNKIRRKLFPGSVEVCPSCGRVKSASARHCGDCMRAENVAQEDALALEAFNSPEAAAIIQQHVGRKRLDRFARIFGRWRRWRRKYVHILTGPVERDGHACACGAYKPLCNKLCDTCRDAKMILRRRISQQGRDLNDEPPIVQKREPRVIRLLTPGIYTSDPGACWDDIIKIIENNRR